MIKIGATVEDDALDAGLHRAFGDELANDRSRRLVGAGLAILLKGFLQRRGRGKGDALLVVDHLRIDVLRRAEYRKARAQLAGGLQRLADARPAECDFFELGSHDDTRYFFLPSLRKMRSSEYLMPLPL